MMNRLLKYLMAAGCALLLAGCATTGRKVDLIGDEMSAALKSCKSRLTKSELIAQAGSPSAREPRNDGGELWLYEFNKQETLTTKDITGTYQGQAYNFGGGRTSTHDYAMRVSIGFNAQGIMDDWRYNGNLAAFPDNAFRTLSSSAPPLPTIDEAHDKLVASLSNAMNSDRVFQADILEQAGPPATKEVNNQFGGEDWFYIYENGQEGQPNYRKVTVKIIFNAAGEMYGHNRSFGHLLAFPDIPFYDLKIPDARPGAWVKTTGARSAKILFNEFPQTEPAVQWSGPVDQGLAHGKGAVKIFSPTGQEVGCYIATLNHGRPASDVQLIKNPDYNIAIQGLSLGGVAW